MTMDRRTVLALVSLGIAPSRLAAAQPHLHQLRKKPEEYHLQFFTGEENEVLDRVASLIIPADARSPGAHEARVSYYIDLVAAHSRPATQAAWKDRLKAFALLARERYQLEFSALAASQQAELLDRLAVNEASPSQDAEHFFADVKRMTIAGYYTSEIGLIRELQYKGNQALASFPGCATAPR